MRRNNSQRWRRVALYVGAALCVAAGLWHGARTRAQQPQQDKRQIGVGGNAPAQRKVALVIGNAAYQHVRSLRNPANDATDIAASLKGLGFELIGGGAGVNLTQSEMKKRIRALGESLRGGGAGVFYFAGHGVQLNGRNYLLPVEIEVHNQADIEDAAVDAQFVLSNMGYAENGVNIVMLDACRNSPFENMTGPLRDVSEGLAKMSAPSGTLIAYATQPSHTAGDGDGRNGAYTAELLKQLGQRGLGVLDLFQQVGTAVYEGTKRQQDPWIEGTPRTRFCFAGCETAAAKPTVLENQPAPVAVPDRVALEKDHWREIENSTEAEDFSDYLAEVGKGTYPGNYAASARTKLRRLETTKGNANNKPPEVRPPPAAPVNVPAPTRTAEQAFYENARTADDYCAYLRNYPDGQFAALARPRAGNCFMVPANPRVGDYLKSPNTNIELAWIPAGWFMMGSPETEKDRGADEGPQRKVTFREGFWMWRTEVTQAQYQAVTGSNPSNFKNCPTCPVEQVSWDDAQAFVQKLNGKNDGFIYSLPTEAQWEYAARAGTTTPFSFGSNITTDQANYDGNYPYNGAAKGKYLEKTAPVGSYPANAWGLYDMHGNVREWCEDWYAKSYADTPIDGSANSKTDKYRLIKYRVVRGGSWSRDAARLRSAVRSRNVPTNHYAVLGFRVVARVRTS